MKISKFISIQKKISEIKKFKMNVQSIKLIKRKKSKLHKSTKLSNNTKILKKNANRKFGN